MSSLPPLPSPFQLQRELRHSAHALYANGVADGVRSVRAVRRAVVAGALVIGIAAGFGLRDVVAIVAGALS